MALLSHGWSFALACIFPSLLFAGSANDASVATYHTIASEVRVTFFATDIDNHVVDPISSDDFAVVDGEVVVRNFRSLTRSTETSLDIVAVVDASESVASRIRTTMNDVLQLTSHKLLSSDDNISVVSFSGLGPVLLCSRDCSSPAAGRRLMNVKAGGPTPLFDAVTYAASYISKHCKPGVRQVLILFSDGDDTISMVSAHDALDAVSASGAVLYAVDLNDSRDASNGSIILERMADATGGRYFSVREGTSAVLQAALAELRASYIVTYPIPRRTAGFHSLRILPKHNLNLRFHCRSGYFYDEDVR